MNKKKKVDIRALIFFGASAAVFAAFCIVLFFTQVVNADKYSSKATTVSSYNVNAAASRGEILDRNGNALVYNEQVNTIVFNALYFPSATNNSQRNSIIISLINYLENKDEAWIDTLPLVFGAGGKIEYADSRESDIVRMKSADMLQLNPYATAQNCFDALLEEFEITGLSAQEARKVASVRYAMKNAGFSAETPYTFAQDVSVQTIAYIKENNDFYVGVDVSVVSSRRYIGDGTVASHLLGVVGAIDSTEYAEKKLITDEALKQAGTDEERIAEIKATAYSINDKIGKNGIEQAFEEYLRGKSGVLTVSVDSDGNTNQEYSVTPQTGGTVISTLDLNLQQIAQSSLNKQIRAVTDSEALAKGMTLAGAVVVEDVETGALLASASDPTYSLSTYFKNYTELSENNGKPLWNRAFQSAYSPGSTMKPAIALAALEEGIITGSTVLNCSGTYTYIDQTFACFGQVAHGFENVKGALAVSCNIFFFELARKLGIEKMNAYSSLLGLGQKTGVEISEATGILAGIAYRDSIGKGWKAGETLLAAIGQSDNSFTPLQLVNYCATIANGGTRYVPYLVSKVLSADYSRTLYERNPKIAVETNISQDSINTVKEGMYSVANETSCEPYLGHLKYKVACKTGTAEKTRLINGVYVDGTDGFLIAFGPYDNPKIAIAVVIENAGSGSSTAQVAADIFNYYFSTIDSVSKVQDENTLLG